MCWAILLTFWKADVVRHKTGKLMTCHFCNSKITFSGKLFFELASSKNNRTLGARCDTCEKNHWKCRSELMVATNQRKPTLKYGGYVLSCSTRWQNTWNPIYINIKSIKRDALSECPRRPELLEVASQRKKSFSQKVQNPDWNPAPKPPLKQESSALKRKKDLH